MADPLLAGRYRLREPLGSGGMGTVWRAHDELLGRDVAVKRIDLPDEASGEERALLCERASREARAAAMIDHPGIVTVHDVVVADALPWIVMELVEGRSLADAVREDGPQEPRRVAAIGLELLAALTAAHGAGLIHRDVKPGNVLLARDGRVVLTDFGIATLDGDPALTRTGLLTGSPGYIAPERLRDEPAGPASDLWSLGAALYAAAEGRGPFDRDTPMAALGAALTEEAPYPVRSGGLAPVLLGLLAKDPAKRIGATAARERVGAAPGRAAADLLGRPVADLGLPDELVATLVSAEPRSDEIHVGDTRVLVVNTSPVRSRDRAMGNVVTLRDHTELQGLTGELDTVRGFAESLRSQAHEAANRLHTVVSLVELGRPGQAVSFATADLETAQRLTDRVVGSVTEPVLAALLLGKSAEAGERGVELAISDDTAIEAVIDPRDLVTILGNLIDNAVDAAIEGAAVRPPRVTVAAREEGGALVLEVSDSGPGVDPSAVPAMFRRGWTTKTTEGPVGHGLGLALAGQAIRRHNGTIRVTTPPASGATFTVHLPAPEG
ncbi:GHKL domain-containing protein, partial [Actinomadura darangshiensis]